MKENKFLSVGNKEIPYTYFPSHLLSVNLAVGNTRGFQGRGILQLIGNEKTGKTSLTFSIIAASQKTGNLKEIEVVVDKIPRLFNAAYIDVERSFDREYAKVCGVDVDKLLIIRTEDAEDFMKLVEELLREGLQLFVWDSLPATITKAEMEREIDDAAKMASTANVVSRWLTRLTPLLYNADALMIVINQWRANLSPMARKETKPFGPKALAYWSKHILELARIKNEGTSADVKITVTKNKQAAEGNAAEVVLRYGEGFDADLDLITLAINLGIIETTGKGRYEYNGVKAHGLGQCKENFDMNKLFEDVMKVV